MSITQVTPVRLVGFPLVLVAGRWYQSQMHGTPGGGNTVTVTAGILYATLFWVPNPITAISLNVHVTTLAAGNCRPGIYNDSNGAPGSLVVDGGALSTGTTGVKTATISTALTPGLYWLAVLFEAAPAVRSMGGTPTIVLGFSSNSDTTIHQGVEASQAYGALPSTFPASSLSTGDHPRVVIGF